MIIDLKTKESNKLIHKFRYSLIDDEDKEILHPDAIEYYENDDLHYHSSWDLLMEVLSLIEGLGFDSRIHGNDSDGGFLCDIVDHDNKEIVCITNCDNKGLSKFQCVYLAITDFIKWYNASNENDPFKEDEYYMTYSKIFNKMQAIIKYELTETSRHLEKDVINAIKKITATTIDEILIALKFTNDSKNYIEQTVVWNKVRWNCRPI